ncbi:bile acid:sodium symporter [Saccharospirillum sp. MSK14-1]|uniref:bile acid:sodium symporter family protein n=1 Tax=Saccharospirillum sp. MSK14-1 TaxID=1897632 RepID=UPI000D4603A4|nr:bile acid:sodium symporter family protein [Saccharospirillum sp. MSK14-1]PTY39020.1 bile acid:sodium symporter [Saccharospirillum sp. MSK14-1]
MLDQVRIDFDPASLDLLNALLALMMFAAALSVRTADFRYILRSPKAPVIGLICQFLLLPAATYGLTRLLDLSPSIALGMILVAACPGGSFSNIMTWLSRGHLATSVSMTAISSTAALVMTPLNFMFYAQLNPDTRPIVEAIAVEPWQLMKLVAMVLVIPLFLGMFVGQRYPEFARRADRPARWLSLLIFLVFVGIAFTRNGDLFVQHAASFAGLVILHNAVALSLGWGSARLAGLSETERRAVTLEVGIQNSGLGLIILFSFYPHLGGMMLIAAFWGVWHLVSGLTLSAFWSRRPPQRDVAAV